MTTSPARSLRRLLSPRSIVVLGGDPAQRVVEQCRRLGFDGALWAVHPHRTEIGGVPCVPSIDDLPGVPDAAFVGVNRRATVDAVRRLAAIGAGGAVCYGSGFAEAGADDLQVDLISAAGAMPILGPNCYGIVNTFDRVALWPDEHGCRPHDRGVAIVSQSGNVACNLTFQRRGVRLATTISVGNQAVIGSEDCIDALLDDERVTTIGLFVEAVRDADRFAEVARRAHDRCVPIVALQTGRSTAGAAIATSHTGSMAGRAAAYDAMFARYGVATVSTPSELLESLKLLDGGGRLSGPRLVSLSCSGGEASLVADRAEGTPLVFEPFAEEHRARIESTLTELVSVSNPFDYHTFMWGDRDAMARCFGEVMSGPQDLTMLVLDGPTGADNDASAWHVAADALADAADATGNRAVVVASMAECLDETFRDRIVRRGIVPLLGLAESLVALEVAATIGRSCGDAHATVTAARRTTLVDEADAKRRLAEIGVPVPHGCAVALGEVRGAAADVDGPVTLKALGFAHKSEHGAVRVGLRSAADVEQELAAMPVTDRYLVEATVTDAVAEVLVAVRRDPPIGWLVTVGAGGVLTEVWSDVVHMLAPVRRDDVLAALDRLRIAPVLRGIRGRPAADTGALADLVVRLVDAVVGTGAVEVELNPVLVRPVGGGAVAVDALWIEELDR